MNGNDCNRPEKGLSARLLLDHLQAIEFARFVPGPDVHIIAGAARHIQSNDLGPAMQVSGFFQVQREARVAGDLERYIAARIDAEQYQLGRYFSDGKDTVMVGDDIIRI